jgi:hypothetical protein
VMRFRGVCALKNEPHGFVARSNIKAITELLPKYLFKEINHSLTNDPQHRRWYKELGALSLRR